MKPHPLVHAAVFFSLAPAIPATAQPRYQVTAIGHLPGSFATNPLAMNNLGEVVGWCQGPLSQLRPFRFIPGTGITQVPLPPGYTEGFATDITDNGIIVGRASNGFDSAGRETPKVLWRLRDGVHTIIGQPAGCSSPVADAVNTSGEVVGLDCTIGPFYYSDAAGLIALDPLGIREAIDINNAGVVTGRSHAGPAFRWSFGGPLELIGTLPGDDYAIGLAINESAAVTGLSANAITGIDPTKAFRFTDATGVEGLPSAVATRSAGVGINESGHIVGNLGSSTSPERQAWVYTPARGVEILHADFVGDANFYNYNGASDINDRGQIASRAGQFEPFDPAPGVILTPVPTCTADFDGRDGVTVQDIFDFLIAYFANDPRADINGVAGVTVQDIFDFLSAYFAGCP